MTFVVSGQFWLRTHVLAFSTLGVSRHCGWCVLDIACVHSVACLRSSGTWSPHGLEGAKIGIQGSHRVAS